MLALALASVAALATQCARMVDAVDYAGSLEAGADTASPSPASDSSPPSPDTGSPNTEGDAPDSDDAPGALDGGPSLVWPDAGGSPNSDPGLVINHDRISELRPRVIVLDYFNGMTYDAARTYIDGRVAAVADSSRYHGYADPTAPTFLNYFVVDVRNLTDNPRPDASPNESSSYLPVGDGGAFDVSQLFTQAFAANYGVADPTGSSPFLNLCQLFEQGYINELWLMTGDEMTTRRPPLFLEKKQAYDSQNPPQARQGVFVSTGTTPWPDDTTPYCKVTTRIAYVSPQRGEPCDLISYSTGIENMSVVPDALGRVAIPYLERNAGNFFNSDFRTRYVTSFNSWSELVGLGSNGWCTGAGTACISYPSDTVAQGTKPAGDGGLSPWTINSFHQGCGTAHFPPNATFEFDWNDTALVASRCEHYGLRDGADGGDVINRYSWNNAYVTAYTTQYMEGQSCGGGWQVYLRQNMPGLNNTAYATDGTRMKNWWPFLFY